MPDDPSTNPEHPAPDLLSDQLRALVTWAAEHHGPDIDPKAIRRAGAGPEPAVWADMTGSATTTTADPIADPITLRPVDGRRRPPTPAVVLAAVAAVAVIAGLLVATLARTGPDDVQTGSSTPPTAGDEHDAGVPPRPTALPPAGDDPLVTCDLHQPHRVFRRSALDAPTGAEHGGDPASDVLRAQLDPNNPIGAARSPLGPGLSADGWRRLAEGPDHVLFGRGTLPWLSFLEVDRQPDGTWRAGSSGGGECTLTLIPDGLTPLPWGTQERTAPDPGTIELHIVVDDGGCWRPLDPAKVLGPDVVEDDESVTIRVAYDEPLLDFEDPACGHGPGRGAGNPPTPLQLTVVLDRPLGDRAVLDGGSLPARRLEFSDANEPMPPEAPVIDAGGALEVALELQVNRAGTCAPLEGEQSGCPAQMPASSNATVHVRTAAADHDIRPTYPLAAVKARVPEGLLEVVVDAPGYWCPSLRITMAADRPPIGWRTINCVDLSLPHATVRGRLDAPDPSRYEVYFRGGNRLGMSSIEGLVADDGTYEVVLEPGTWFPAIKEAGSSVSCGSIFEAAAQITVAGGVDQTFDPALPSCLGGTAG